MLREEEYALEEYWDLDGLCGSTYGEQEYDNFEGDLAELAREHDDAEEVKKARFVRILNSARAIAGRILGMNLRINGMLSDDPDWITICDIAVSS